MGDHADTGSQVAHLVGGSSDEMQLQAAADEVWNEIRTNEALLRQVAEVSDIKVEDLRATSQTPILFKSAGASFTGVEILVVAAGIVAGGALKEAGADLYRMSKAQAINLYNFLEERMRKKLPDGGMGTRR